MNQTALLEKKLKRFSTPELEAFMLEERRKLGLSDLFYHNKYILGYKDLEKQPHKELCDWITDWSSGKTKKLFIGPRDSFKSSLDVIGYSTQLIAENPLVKIFITSEVEDNAKKYLTGIQNHLLGNSTYRQVYPHLYRDYAITTSNTECVNIVPVKEQKQVFEKEHTVDVGGIGTVEVGMHYDYIFFVDPHSQRNVNTKEQIEKVVVYYKLLNSIKKANTGRLIVEMNRWSFFDLASHILNNEKDLFDVCIKSAYNEDGSLFFPQRLNQKYLDEKLRELGSYLHSCLYLSSPRSDKDKIFKPEIAVFYDVAPAGLEKWLLCDPSISEKESADDFALLTLGLDRKTNDIYVLDKLRVNRKMPSQAISEMVLMLKRNFEDQPKFRAAIESVSFQRIYKFELERELSKEGKSFEVKELQPQGRAKKMRITGLQPFYEAGKIKLRAGKEDEVSPDLDLLLQLEKFPFDKDDFCDLLAYALDLIKPKKEFPSINKEATYNERQVRAVKEGRQAGFRRRYS